VVECTLARTGAVMVRVFWHVPGDPVRAVEHWPAASLTFTSPGAWEVRSGAGSGLVDERWLLAGRPGEEYECRHPDGVIDRALSVAFLDDVEPAAPTLLPVGKRGRLLWRLLRRAVAARQRDAEEIDAAALSLLEWARHADERAPVIGARTRGQVAAVRREAERRLDDPALDLVAVGRAVGLSRTRLIHSFREVTGVTPHRFLLERRLSLAARLLGCTRAGVAEVCFASGFGNLARFNAAFKSAYGLAPTAYRAVCRHQSSVARW
jgi:AraC-like DNA-binding protein